MKYCKFKDKLSAYIDAELTDKESRIIELHLNECTACREELARLRAISDFSFKQKELADDNYWERSAAKIERALPDRSDKVLDIKNTKSGLSLGMGWRLTAVAASIALLTFIGLHDDEILPGLKEMQDEVQQNESVQTAPPSFDYDSLLFNETEQSENLSGEKEVTQTEISNSSKMKKIVPVEEDGKTEVLKTGLRQVSKTNQLEAVGEIPVKKYQAVGRSRQSGSNGGGEAEMIQLKAISNSNNTDQSVDIITDKNENYREKRKRDVIYSSPPISAPSSIQTVQPTDKSIIFGNNDTDDLINQELDYWRTERDSLLSERKLKREDNSRDYIKSIKDNTPMLRSKISSISGLDETALKGLIHAWYEICRLTTDSTERDNGRKYLKSIAESNNQPADSLAKSYLAKLGK